MMFFIFILGMMCGGLISVTALCMFQINSKK